MRILSVWLVVVCVCACALDVVIELGGTVSFVDCFRRDISTVMFTTLFGGDIPEKDGTRAQKWAAKDTTDEMLLSPQARPCREKNFYRR